MACFARNLQGWVAVSVPAWAHGWALELAKELARAWGSTVYITLYNWHR